LAGIRTATDLSAPTPAEFAAAVEQGRLDVGSPQGQRLVGKMALRSFLADVTAPAFEEALAIVRQG